MKNKKGIALILAIGILAILAVIATSFALNMRLEYKAAMNYYNGVKARYLADAALQRAIAELKADVKSSAFDDLTETWAGGSNSYEDYIFCETSPDAYTTIKDEQRWVNVNYANVPLLVNLFSQLTLPAGSSASGLKDKILNNKPAGGYKNIRELVSIAGLTPGGDGEFDAIKGYITVHSYFDTNAGNRSPVNVNTASLEVLKSVLRIGIVPANIADGVALEIHDRVDPSIGNAPFTSWRQFNQYIDNLTQAAYPDYVPDFTTTYADYVKNNCNPNSAANKLTTEFCFNSGGYYTITATGIAGGAERTLNAVVKVYDIINYTTKAQFQAPGAIAKRVTWLDTCPLNSNSLFGSPAFIATQQPQPIAGSIKLGYWDNFEEDRISYSAYQWLNESFQNNRGVGGSYALIGTEGAACNLWNTASGWDWTLDNFSLRTYVNEYDISNAVQMKDVAWVVLRETDGSAPFTNAPSVMHTRNGVLSWDNTGYGYLNNVVGLPGETGSITFMTVSQYTTQTGYGSAEAITDRHRYGTGQVRIFNSYANNNPEDYDNSSWRSVLTYDQIKTFNIRASGTTITVDAWDNASNRASPYPFSRSISGVNTSGRLVLFSNNVKTAWDNIRIIPDDGEYTSPVIPSPTGGAVRWGTITGTITQGNFGDILLRTTVSGGLDESQPSVDLEATNHFLGLGSYPTASSIRFGATLTTSSPYQETPVLEDVTITYLPKTKIVSYTFSSQ